MLDGKGLWEVREDVMTLAAFAGCLMALGILAFSLALAYARRRGTLSQY
jgi:hypothetical protein